MNVSCPRCHEPIEADWDHCHHCGLTVAQLDRLYQGAGLRVRSPGALEAEAADVGASRSRSLAGSPGYYAQPVYGEGPIRRSTGYAPPSPGVSDLRRNDTIIDLDDGEAVVTVVGTGATAPAPQGFQPPKHEPRTPNARTTVSTTHKVELALTVGIAIALIFVAILFVL